MPKPGLYPMMNMNSFNKALVSIQANYEKKLVDIEAELGASVEDMATVAKSLALKNQIGNREGKKTGNLASKIYAEKVPNVKIGYSLVADTRYAAFVEFGTGKYAATYVPNLDEEWQQLAKEYYVDGSGKTPAQPYFYPAVKRIFPKLIQRLKAVLNS